MSIKLSVLDRNGQFSVEERAQLGVFQHKFRSLCLTVISFQQVHYSYDRVHLHRLLVDTGAQLEVFNLNTHLSMYP
jgi:hypothetical protein